MTDNTAPEQIAKLSDELVAALAEAYLMDLIEQARWIRSLGTRDFETLAALGAVVTIENYSAPSDYFEVLAKQAFNRIYPLIPDIFPDERLDQTRARVLALMRTKYARYDSIWALGDVHGLNVITALYARIDEADRNFPTHVMKSITTELMTRGDVVGNLSDAERAIGIVLSLVHDR